MAPLQSPVLLKFKTWGKVEGNVYTLMSLENVKIYSFVNTALEDICEDMCNNINKRFYNAFLSQLFKRLTFSLGEMSYKFCLDK